MRIAVIRAGHLNPFELANFGIDGEVVAFGSRAGSFDAHGLPVEARRLASPSDVVARLPYLARGAIGRFVGDVDLLAGLAGALRGFDVAHTAELSTPYSWQAVRAREAGAVKRTVATVWENIAFPVATNRAVARRVERVAAGLDRALAISERARLHLELHGVPADRIEVIPMGVDLERFAPRGAERRPGGLRVLSVSRLVAEKGVEDLVLAVHLLRERGHEVHATVVGDGPLRPRLSALVTRLRLGDRVTLTGPLAHDRLAVLHHEHDALVLASAPRDGWQEQFGFAVVEAMASGLPVVAGDSGSLDEVVGDRGQLVTPGQPEALAAALLALAGDPGRRARLGAANRRRAEERYDRRGVARRLQTFYAAALAEPPRT